MTTVKDFSPGSTARQLIKQEFLSLQWKEFRQWFFEVYTSQDLDNISKEFYEFTALHNKIIPFVPWFITTYLNNYINILERSYQFSDGKQSTELYPPQKLFTLPNNTSSPCCNTCNNNNVNTILDDNQNKEYYNILSQFQDFQINMITNDNILELLTQIQDNDIRSKILDWASTSSSTSSSSNKSNSVVITSEPYKNVRN
ncbi:hypothetical protein ACH5RR_030360 [Cinchona calisaya]|uniref:DUF7588 domain-containing protein n=1 Tax=Cinchona calisaya TaxID=153742 RepID=A0ABD2YUC9_9GENT